MVSAPNPAGDGDGWVTCAAGHRHWGRYGAAGLLLRAHSSAAEGASELILMQHRSAWTHQGQCWGLPGGARDSHEDPVSAALREVTEETGLDTAEVRPSSWWTDSHGGWSYVTVEATVDEPGAVHPATTESLEVRWLAGSAVETLPLHPGLSSAWSVLRSAQPPLTVLVDAANVVGTRPDGWWRDRAAATTRLLDALLAVARTGIPTTSLPAGISVGGRHGAYPHFQVVVEGAARGSEPSAGTGWFRRSCTVVAAQRDGDHTIAALAAAHPPDEPLIVVTADRGLRERLAAHAVAVSPSWLLDLADQAQDA